MVDDQHGVGQQLGGDRGSVSRRRVDHHVGDPGAKLPTLFAQPLADRSCGASFDLSEQALIAAQIDKAGVPGVGAHPPAGVAVAGPAGLAGSSRFVGVWGLVLSGIVSCR